MKRIFIMCVLIAVTVISNAQKITPIRLSLLKDDLYARQKTVLSKKNGQPCSVIRVDVVGIKDLVFPEAEQQPTYSQNEYIVYVPAGAKSLTYKHGKETGTIIFSDYGPDEVEGKSTYRLMMDTEAKMRSALFYVQPQNAELKINNKKVSLDGDGIGAVDLEIGKYTYTISSKGYHSETGVLTLKEDEIITVKDIKLNEIKYNYSISCNKPSASLFVDGRPYGPFASTNKTIQLAEGKHKIRVTLEGYEDFMDDINLVNDHQSSIINLKEKKAKIIKHKNERTKSSISIRPHRDVLFSDATLIDDFGTQALKIGTDFHQYIGLLAFKEGISIGGTYGSKSFCKKIDDYTELFEVENPKRQNRIAMTLEIPLQLGFTLPLSRYNTSNVDFLGGGYATGYYIGHSSENTQTKEAVSTYSCDFGVRANVTFYFNRFIIGFEGTRSLSKLNLGTFVGVNIGYRIYKHKVKEVE